MKKIWKALGIAALAAAVPVRFKRDEETGKKTFQSLLWKLDIGPAEDGGTEIGLDLMEGVVTAPLTQIVTAKKETIHFADDEPEAAVVPDVIDFTQAVKAQEESSADAPVDEPAAPVEEDNTPASSEEATEEDFDPEL